MSTIQANINDPGALLAFPECEGEVRRAVEQLASAAGERADAPTRSERVNEALNEMRYGDVRRGFAALTELAAAGDAMAPHLLAWLHRYRALGALRAAAGLFELAVERGYEPSRPHHDRVTAMLDVPLSRAHSSTPPRTI
ncbi:MAG: hypothetical protein ACREN2_00140 [Candidatus Dormibacteria bacterium]